MIIKNKIIILICLFSLLGCKKETSFEKEKLINYIKDEDNGFSQTKEINGFKINLTYRPTDLLVLQEMSNLKKNNFSKNEEDSIRNKYKKNIYFILSYSKDDKELLSTITSSREQFNLVQNTLTFGMQDKVIITNNKNDSIQLIDYNCPRTYGMSKSTNLLFIFNRDEVLKKSNQIIFNVQDIGIGIGDIKFRYPSSIINDN